MSPIKSRKHHVPQHGARPLTAATLLTGIALAVPFASAARDAGSAGPDAARTLDRLEVHGERIRRYGGDAPSSPKFTQPLLETTQTIQVIGSDLFNEQGATTLTEALRNSPGVGTFYAGENGNTTTGDAIYLRGFDTSGSIFVDGVRDLGSISRDVFNIEQVEVTKGPAGTDTGRTAPSGSINLVTKRPSLRDASSVSASVGSAEQARVSGDFNSVLGTGGTALRVNVMAQEGGVPGRDHVERNRWAVAPSLGFGLDGATRVYLDLLHVEQDNVPDGGVPTIGLPGYASPDPERPFLTDAPRVDPENFYGTRSDFDDVTADMATLRVEHEVSEATRLHNTTRWGRTQQDYMLTAFMGTPANIVTPDPAAPSTWTLARNLPTFKDQANRILTNQTTLTTAFATARVEHALSTGVEFIREELETGGTAVLDGSAWPAANLYAPDRDVTGLEWGPSGAGGEGRTDTVAVYAFDTVTFNPRWELNAGVRVDRYETEFSNTVVCGGRGAPPCGDLPSGSVVPGVDAEASDTLFNWKAGALYKPAENGSVYANYAVARQPPGGANLELSNSASNANNPALEPQEARTAEVGTKWNLLDEQLMLTAAVYDTEVRNEVFVDTDGSVYQTGRKQVRGVELSAVGQLTEAWAVSAGYTVMDTEVVSGQPVASDGSSELTYTPDSAFTAWSTYSVTPALTLGGGARHVGGLKRGTDGAVGTPTSTDSYWVVDAVASYALAPGVDLRLNVYNLFDEAYVAAINKSGYRYTPGIPRSVMLTANFRF
jgi:catecholate siderophore receptor